MKILVGTLFIAVAIFPNFVELRSPRLTYTEFPRYLEHAPIVASRYPQNPASQLVTLLRSTNLVPLDTNMIIISRGPIIFGLKHGHVISPLYENDSSGYKMAIYDEALEEISIIEDDAISVAMGVGKPAPPVTVHTPEIGSRRDNGINDDRPYEYYDSALPDFLYSAPIVALRYPRNPEPKVKWLLRFIDNHYVPCDEDTIIIQRGPTIFGYMNENGYINGFRIFKLGVGYDRAIYDVELRELCRVSLNFHTAMGMGKKAPRLAG